MNRAVGSGKATTQASSQHITSTRAIATRGVSQAPARAIALVSSMSLRYQATNVGKCCKVVDGPISGPPGILLTRDCQTMGILPQLTTAGGSPLPGARERADRTTESTDGHGRGDTNPCGLMLSCSLPFPWFPCLPWFRSSNAVVDGAGPGFDEFVVRFGLFRNDLCGRRQNRRILYVGDLARPLGSFSIRLF